MRFSLICLLSLAGLLGLSAHADANVVLRKMDDKAYASLRNQHGAVLDIRAENPEELLELVKVYSGRYDLKSPWKKLEIKKVNANRAFLPYRHLSGPFRKKFVKALWPKDRLDGSHWIHEISYPHESLWSLAAWFTGYGQNYRKIKKASNLKSDRLRKGQTLKIPQVLLFDFLKPPKDLDMVRPKDPVSARSTPLVEEETVPGERQSPRVSPPVGKEPPTPIETKTEEPKLVEQDSSINIEPKAPREIDPQNSALFREIMDWRRELTYGKDSKGAYAEYRLKRGEAIYSAVVVKYCGLVRADDVNQVAEQIVKRNRVPDVTDMPVGQKLRIPYELIMPEYKASNDPEFIEWLENLKAVENVDTSLVNKGLEGVTVIIDAGHGGRDPGAKKGNTWEDDYVYDILCRVKRQLETQSGAKVLPTIVDPSVGYRVQDVNQFTLDHDEKLNTHPKFSLKRDTRLGVNMRWVFSNHHYHKILKAGKPKDQVVFISLHADSLHSGLRGSMVYVPDARSYPKGKITPAAYFKKYKEYSNAEFHATKREMEKAQALSSRLGMAFLDELRKRNLPVHKQLPIRSVIFRKPRSRPFVPAVLKYNRVPMRVLLEVCNLNNAKDRALIRDVTYRQQVAESIVASLETVFGAKTPLQVAKKRDR